MTNVDSGGRAAAEPNTILRATVGSKLHGLNLEATDDTDEMGVCVEPPEYVVGLRKFEQWVYRTQPEGHPSGPKDLDLTIYSLRKWVRLAQGLGLGKAWGWLRHQVRDAHGAARISGD